ncbi:unnamed protein product [Closterium sp. NIES-54]
MYIAYGWPKVLRTTRGPDDPVVHLEISGGLLIVVHLSCIQLWTSSVYPLSPPLRVPPLPSPPCTPSPLPSVYPLSPPLPSVYPLSPPLRVPPLPSPRAPPHPLLPSPPGSNGMVADEDHILLGLSSGRLHLVSWRGQVSAHTGGQVGGESTDGHVRGRVDRWGLSRGEGKTSGKVDIRYGDPSPLPLPSPPRSPLPVSLLLPSPPLPTPFPAPCSAAASLFSLTHPIPRSLFRSCFPFLPSPPHPSPPFPSPPPPLLLPFPAAWHGRPVAQAQQGGGGAHARPSGYHSLLIVLY